MFCGAQRIYNPDRELENLRIVGTQEIVSPDRVPGRIGEEEQSIAKGKTSPLMVFRVGSRQAHPPPIREKEMETNSESI